ncbi:FRG domain-containing protein [Burkholderia ambifaria]|uniref:FRG domain-containing protein n=1 Tax=Burkholderia ambifaria TaxID=152480 RepID=UPI00158B9002|nr:FRG domain-containing protein [Burkholderia ambifaria]
MAMISTFEQLHAAFDAYRSDKRWIFRGHAKADWPLIPKAGREPYQQIDDKVVFQSWRRQAVAYITSRPQDDWEWLAVGQHHGLATRLLDWSLNPLVACYFAVREQQPGDAIVYAAKFQWTVPPETESSPHKFSDLAVFRTHRIAERITSQSGAFTIHPDPKLPIRVDSKGVLGLDEIRISEGFRNTLRSQLSYYGFNDATLFPGLDGVSSHINWTIEAKEYWKQLSPSVI